MEDFVKRNRELIRKEREAEIEENKLLLENVSPKVLEQKGLCLLKLYISRRFVGLFNRNVLVLTSDNQLPAHGFTTGDIVSLSLSSGNNVADVISSGVISKIHQSSITIAFDGNDEQIFNIDESQLYKIVRITNDVTYRRLQKTLDVMEGKGGHLIDVLFGASPLNLVPNEIKEIKYFNNNLNESQRGAVKFALESKEVAVIHGPPGTGKTTTVVEVVRQAIQMDMKVLVCAPSNIAVDNLVEKLSTSKIRMVRIGHPARLLPSIARYSLDAVVSSSDGAGIARDVRKDIDNLLKNFRSRDPQSRLDRREELRALRVELREREEQTICDVLSRCQVVLCTLTVASEQEGQLTRKRVGGDFDLVVVDECSQALEVACWTAILRGRKCVLAGDHRQLPPTILSSGEVKEQLEVTLMERLIDRFGGDVVRMLTTQYRMNERIMAWSSRMFYDGKLAADASVAGHLLRHLPGVEDREATSAPLLLVDTSGCGFHEVCLQDQLSKGNEGEADIVCHHVKKLLKCGLKEDQIGVIVPYNLQVEILRQKLHSTYPGLEIKSVDGFQGREKEAIVVSLVRSNTRGDVGFLSERRRTNVAFTRARRHLAIVCDSETVGHEEFVRDFLEYASEAGEIVSGHELMSEAEASNEYLPKARFDGREKPKSQKKTLQKGTSEQTKGRADNSKKSDKRNGTSRNSKTMTTKAKEAPSNFSQNQQPRRSDEERRDYFRELLTQFMKDQSTKEHLFPPTLTSLDRLIIHQLCEQLGLVHISEGEKFERFIRVSKKGEEEKEAEEEEDANDEAAVTTNWLNKNPFDDLQPLEETEPIIDDIPDDCDAENVPAIDAPAEEEKKWNFSRAECYWSPFGEASEGTDFGSTSCATTSQPKPTDDDKIKPTEKSTRNAAAAAAKEKPPKHPPAATTGESFDDIVKEAMRYNSRCAHDACKKSVTVLGQDCAFCRRRFCLTHHIAEAHGCGEAARVAARKVISREGKLFSGSGVPSKALKPEKRAYLKSKLEGKLDNMAEKRRGQSSKDKK